jgi:hypothetical protein
MKNKTVVTLGGLLLAVAVGIWMLNSSSAPPIDELAKSATPTTAYLSNKIIPDSDLPPSGTRSLFDHIIAQNDGMPYPFSKMIKLLKDQNPSGAEPIKLLIGSGRSLLKGSHDNAHPRIVVAADFEGNNTPAGLGKSTRGQLFLGFVEKAHELEVISYNEAAGRFEYQLVQNYCEGCVPRIVYARRAICLTCHQGGTPIFSVRSWNETNGQPATAEAIIKARGNSNPYEGVPMQVPLAHSERFDQLTDIGNFYLAAQRLWLDGCGETGNECRRQMLSLALQYADNAGGFDKSSPDAKMLRELQAVSFPKEGIMVAESDIHNRDPLDEKKSVKEWLKSLFYKGSTLDDGDDHLSSFDKLPPLTKELDPLTLRPPKQTVRADDLDGAFNLARFFTEADLKMLSDANGRSQKKLQERIRALPAETFAAKPFSRVVMMTALLGKPVEYCCLKTDELSPPIVSGIPPLAIKEFPELKGFEEYCFACHRGNPAKRLDFMAGDTEKIALDNIKAKTEIRDALDWTRYEGTDKASKLMPPRDSPQYRKMKEAGAAADAAREKMRETVPGMFGF